MDSIPAEEFEETGMNWLTANRQKVAFKTTHRRLTSLRQFSKWAGWGFTFEDYTPPTPAPAMPHPLPEGIDGVLRMVEQGRNCRQQGLVALLGLMGLRISEALAVRPEDFNFENMTLRVHGKGEKIRNVPISDHAMNVLAPVIIEANVAGSATVLGMRDRYARALITRLAEKAQLRRAVSSHDLRATFATEVYNKTKDGRLVQILLGHASGQTTEIYIGKQLDELRVGVELV